MLQIAGSLGINRKELNISELTRSLAPSGIEITTLHWSRVAFLVSKYTSHQAQIQFVFLAPIIGIFYGVLRTRW